MTDHAGKEESEDAPQDAARKAANHKMLAAFVVDENPASRNQEAGCFLFTCR